MFVDNLSMFVLCIILEFVGLEGKIFMVDDELGLSVFVILKGRELWLVLKFFVKRVVFLWFCKVMLL